MVNQKIALKRILAALLLLFAVSVYRQLSLRFWPGDALRPYLVFAVYLVLCLHWGFSIHWRVTQRAMRVWLLAADALMLLWFAVRFVQEAFLYRHLYALRLTGYLITIPAVLIPLFGLYTALCLGRTEDYRLARGWYALLLPAALLIVMALTDRWHHFVFSVVPGEPQPNLYFHPYIGIYLIYLWISVLCVARVNVIYRRNRPQQRLSALHRVGPFLEMVCFLLFSIPYVASSYWVRFEIIEYSAGVCFLEAASWEMCICIGLIPVNTGYREVFERSTVAMQILDERGEVLVRSSRAQALPPEMFARLKAEKKLSLEGGTQLSLYPLSGALLVWQEDVSQLLATIATLQHSAGELEQEGALLREELRTKSEEARVKAQNEIYDSLTRETGQQLTLLRGILKKRDAGADRDRLFRQLFLIGTYIKRRCNLRLIEKETGRITAEDLRLSFADMMFCLTQMGTDARLCWQPEETPGPEFSLFLFDALELLLEQEHFSLRSLSLAAEQRRFVLTVCPQTPLPGKAPAEELRQKNTAGYAMTWEQREDGYRLCLAESGV